jgi:phytoene dehydrogenase-like protein
MKRNCGGTIIIIGAGISGLAAGCYAQMNGYRSHIFELATD